MLKPQKAYPVYLLLSFLVSMLFWMAFSMDSVYFVVEARLDPLQLVLVGTTLEITVLLFEIPTGIVADLYSRRLSVLIGYFLVGLGLMMQGIWAFFVPILLAQLVWGTGHTFTSGALQAWITDEIGEENAGAAFLHGAQREQLGGALGIIIGTALGAVNLRLPLLIAGGMFLFLAALLAVIMPENNFKPAPRETRHTFQNMLASMRQGLGMLKVRPVLVSILSIGFFYGIYSEGFDRLWIALMLERFTFPLFSSVIWFGFIQIVELGLSALALGLVKKRLDHTGNRPLIKTLLIASAGLSLTLGLFAFAGQLWFAIGLLWAIGVLRRIIYPLHTTWVNQKLDPQVRATVLSMAGQVDAIGQIAGGPGVGIIARRISMPVGILTSALLLTPVLGLLGRQYNNHEETTSGGE